MNIVKTIFRTLIGGVFGFASALALIPAVATFSNNGGDQHTGPVLWAIAGAGALLGFFAPTIRRAFGRGFLMLGASVFALPLSVMMLSGRVASDMAAQTPNDGATMVGAGIAGTVMTGAAGFIGFFFGTILLIIGLVLALGGRREVIVVERAPAVPAGRREPSL